MSIKMICSDIDGTLLGYTDKEISLRLINQIHALNEKGIVFAPTSGRQIASMYRLFEKASKCCYFICSNGAVICDGDKNVVKKQPMPREDAISIAYDFWNNTDGRGEVNLSGEKCCYVMEKNIGIVDRLKFIGTTYKIISKPEDVDEDIVKVSAFLPDGAVNYEGLFIDKWSKYNAAIAGEYWIDTTLANKGSGVRALCDYLNIGLDEAIAFGDNFNDVSMLDIVGTPYIMDNAVDELTKRYTNHTSCVEDTIDKILRIV